TVAIALSAGRRAEGRAPLALGLLAAVAAAGAATLPGFGAPFAWRAFVARAHADSGWQPGLSPTSSLLPLGYLLTGAHARDVVHTLLLLLGLVAGLAAVELGLRLLEPHDLRALHELRPDRPWLYGMRPNAAVRVGGVTYATNADGFRDRTYPRAKPPGTFRVVVLGDSIA